MNKTRQAIKQAAVRGYRVTQEGEVYGLSGKKLDLRKRTRNGRSYLYFKAACDDGIRRRVYVHRIVAYLKFGDAALAEDIVVRHLNDDPLDNRFENIAIGSRSDNMMDRPEEARRKHAQRAGRSNSLPEETWAAIRKDHAAGMGYKKLKAKYGVPLGTLSYNLSKKAKRTAMIS